MAGSAAVAGRTARAPARLTRGAAKDAARAAAASARPSISCAAGFQRERPPAPLGAAAPQAPAGQADGTGPLSLSLALWHSATPLLPRSQGLKNVAVSLISPHVSMYEPSSWCCLLRAAPHAGQAAPHDSPSHVRPHEPAAQRRGRLLLASSSPANLADPLPLCVLACYRMPLILCGSPEWFHVTLVESETQQPLERSPLQATLPASRSPRSSSEAAAPAVPGLWGAAERCRRRYLGLPPGAPVLVKAARDVQGRPASWVWILTGYLQKAHLLTCMPSH